MPERRDLVRDALGRASGRGEVDLERLAGAVPSILAEAGRRRRAAAAPGARISTAAGSWLPRLAAATALLAVAALAWPAREAATTEPVALERWLLTGSTGATSSDPVVRAVVGGDGAAR